MKVIQFGSLRVCSLMIHTHSLPNISPSRMPLSLFTHSFGSVLMAWSLLVPGSLHGFTLFSLTPLLVVTLYTLAVRPLWPLLVFLPPKSRLLVAGHPLRGSTTFISTMSCCRLFFSMVVPSMTLLLRLFNLSLLPPGFLLSFPNSTIASFILSSISQASFPFDCIVFSQCICICGSCDLYLCICSSFLFVALPLVLPLCLWRSFMAVHTQMLRHRLQSPCLQGHCTWKLY